MEAVLLDEAWGRRPFRNTENSSNGQMWNRGMYIGNTRAPTDNHRGVDHPERWKSS